MKLPACCVYQRGRDCFELALPGSHKGVVHVLTPDEANDLLYELQHAVWARQGADAGEGGL